MNKYRVAFGNGQVQECLNFACAKRELLLMKADPHVESARIHRYKGAGDWVSIAKLSAGEVVLISPRLVL